MSNLNYIEDYLNREYCFRYNMLTQRIFFCKQDDDGNYKLLTEYDLHSICRELSHKNINFNISELKNLLTSDFVPKFNPIQEYFENLSKWDCKKDYIKEFCTKVKTTDDTYFKWVFEKWFVAMIACALEDDLLNHCALIFVGKQGIGKSTFIEKILPTELNEYIYSGKINPKDKDSIVLLSEKVLINMEEIGSFSKSQTDLFKDLLTKSIIQLRRPYSIFSESFVRRASFIGSTNNNDVLADITGNRRFLVVEALEFDFSDYPNKHLLFAQGYNLYRNGFQYWFDRSEIEKVNQANENFRQVSFEEYTLDRFFEVPKPHDKDPERYSATELIETIKTLLEEKSSKELSPVDMGKALSSRGFQKQNKKYLVIRKQL